MELTLEQEFAENVRMHKMAILKKMLLRYYFAIGIVKSNAPEYYIYHEASRKANDEVRHLYINDKEGFERKYEMAYEILKGELK